MKEAVDLYYLIEELTKRWGYPKPEGKCLENSKCMLYPEVGTSTELMEGYRFYEPAYMCSNPISYLENGNVNTYLVGLPRGLFKIIHLKK